MLEQITGEVVSTQGKLSSMRNKAQIKPKTKQGRNSTNKSTKVATMAKKPSTKQLTDGSYAMDGWSY